MAFGLVGVIILIIDIIIIMKVLESPLTLPMKSVWIAIILALPIIGILLWYLIGVKETA